jgi:hydroxymethylpyrimidine/phosphomethylpyrimidine kinase
MEAVNPNILTIAGFDPSAGAGILSDIKTFEAHGEYAMGACTAITIQNDLMFESVEWVPAAKIIAQIRILTERFSFGFVKIGLIESLPVLKEVVNVLKEELPDVKIIWDPVISASAGFEFHSDINKNDLEAICRNIFLITPNLHEAKTLLGIDDEKIAAEKLSQWCNVFLKGGHSEGDMSTDILYEGERAVSFEAMKFENVEKHGSGCVLSSAITANLAKGMQLEDACAEAKAYITDFLISARGLLGIHKPTQPSRREGLNT